MNSYKSGSTSLNYVLISFIAVLITWLIHEFAHWGVGEILGYKMIMTLNGSRPLTGDYKAEWHYTLISIAGPLITIAQAFIYYYLLNKSNSRLLYPFLFTPFYMRLLAGLMNFINLNDEGRVSKTFELGAFTLPLLVSALLFYLVYRISKRWEYGFKFNAMTVVWIMLFSSILILADQFLRIRIL